MLALVEVSTAPDATGYGMVISKGEERPCYFLPSRFRAPWPLPVVGSLVLTTDGPRGLTALWSLGGP